MGGARPAAAPPADLEAVKRLLLRESQVQPLLIVVEDLHWIDSETQALLDSLIESLPSARLLLLVNYRPEYQHGWASKTYYSAASDRPAATRECRRAPGRLLGLRPGLEPLKRLLIERTEGNPLFLEESVRTLVETGVLTGERGAYRLTTDERGIRSLPPCRPSSPLASIDCRRRTSGSSRPPQPSARTCPCRCSRPSRRTRGRACATGWPGCRLRSSYTRSGSSQTSSTPSSMRSPTRWPMASLLQDRRRALHVRIVEAMERLYPNRPAEQLERLAHHAFGRGLGKAVGYLREAGARASARSRYRDARGGSGGAGALAAPPDAAQTRAGRSICTSRSGRALGARGRPTDARRTCTRPSDSRERMDDEQARPGLGVHEPLLLVDGHSRPERGGGNAGRSPSRRLSTTWRLRQWQPPISASPTCRPETSAGRWTSTAGAQRS